MSWDARRSRPALVTTGALPPAAAESASCAAAITSATATADDLLPVAFYPLCSEDT
jgi:hypothetical protein